MPMMFIEAPKGLKRAAKTRLIEEATAALSETYRLPDVRIFLREYAPEDVAQDGRQHAEPFRLVSFLEAPQLRKLDAKRVLVQRLSAALAAAYGDLIKSDETMVFINEYPLDQVSLGGRLQRDNPEAAEVIAALSA